MQTFLPAESFTDAAKQLDGKRLNNQVNECMVILNAVLAPHRDTMPVGFINRFPWIHHPATRMWKHSATDLVRYIEACRMEIKRRHMHDSRANALQALYAEAERIADVQSRPWWLDDEGMLHKVVLTHRANLYFKDPSYYGACFPAYMEVKARRWYDEQTGKPQYCWPLESRHAYVRYCHDGKSC